jgi:8-oxo-dGTP pyrophosphatase MutT (NUDIX family)
MAQAWRQIRSSIKLRAGLDAAARQASILSAILQARHNGRVIEQIRARLLGYEALAMAPEANPQAAVLIPLFEKNGAVHVVLTKRTDRVQNHRGEISFPGGRRETTDYDLAVTALRESKEEIGLLPDDVEIIGRVDDIVTISNYHVTAFVGLIDPTVCPYSWCCQETEVAEVLEVPLTHLLDLTNVVEVPRNRNGQMMLMEAFQFNDHIIFGATARMLRNLLNVTVDDLGELASRIVQD